MRISTRGQYSLEALLYMALLPEGTLASTRSIAENTGLSDGYLEQLFIPLKKAGIVQAVRGAQGGYLPTRRIGDITVGDILRAVEGSLKPVACLSSGTCSAEHTCIIRHTWAQLYLEINACIDSITLADLVKSYHLGNEGEYTI